MQELRETRQTERGKLCGDHNKNAVFTHFLPHNYMLLRSCMLLTQRAGLNALAMMADTKNNDPMSNSSLILPVERMSFDCGLASPSPLILYQISLISEDFTLQVFDSLFSATLQNCAIHLIQAWDN